MARHWKIAIAAVAVLAVIGLITLPALLRTVLRFRGTSVSDEQARRELNQPVIATPTDTRVKAQLFWVSASSPASLEPTVVELPLSADPVQRSKQLIVALIAQPPTPEQRTLPANAELLQFYLLPDGTAIADFSEALSMELPSGILSEQMAVDSLVRTLGENVAGIHLLKILIRGQEADTLAGHLDLTGFFPVVASAPASASAASGASPPTDAAPAAASSAAASSPAAAAASAAAPKPAAH